MKCKKCWLAAAILCAVLGCVGLAGCGNDPTPAAVTGAVLKEDSMTAYLGGESDTAVSVGSSCINNGDCPNNGICDGSGQNNAGGNGTGVCVNNNDCPNGGICDGSGNHFVGGRNPAYFSGHHGGNGNGPHH